MAKQRWATFSVADHLNLRALVPDVLLFDRLVFPYPIDEAEEARWIEAKWDPQLLEYCLLKLDDLAYPVEWGEKQSAEFDANMEQAEKLERLIKSPMEMEYIENDPEKKWEKAKQMSRHMLSDFINGERGTGYWVMPCYRSKDAFLRDQRGRINQADTKSRREALATLVGQKMSVPDDADPKSALGLAIDLARDAGYQRCRRALFNWQETVIQREQSAKDDAQELSDLIADLNNYIATKRAQERGQWIFFVLKRMVGVGELANPLSAAGAVINTCEFISGRGREIAPGAMAAFHHVRERVVEPSTRRQ